MTYQPNFWKKKNCFFLNHLWSCPWRTLTTWECNGLIFSPFLRSGWDAFGISSSKHVIDICGTFHTSSSSSFPDGSFWRSRELEGTRQSKWERLLHLLWESSWRLVNGKFWIIDIFIENTIIYQLNYNIFDRKQANS